ncbi:MAG: hypothetical protein IPM29_29765 [Planctomycetes bacterium]|nr:hypothetical protein [Planctomycetota bacterium]
MRSRTVVLACFLVLAACRDDPVPESGAGEPAIAPPSAGAPLAPDSAFATFGLPVPAPAPGRALVQTTLEPSAEPSTVAIGAGLRLVVPPGFVTGREELRVTEVRETPASPWPHAEVGRVLDVTVGDRHELAEPLLLEIDLDPATPERAPEQLSVLYFDPRAEVWFEHEVRIDASGRRAVVVIRHLSWIMELWRSVWWKTVDAGDVIVHYTNAQLTNIRWTLQHTGTRLQGPPLVVDVAEYARESVAAYRDCGLRMATPRLAVFLLAGVTSKHVANSPYVIVQARDYGDPTILHYVVAHELFHNVELATLSIQSMGETYLASVDAFAEYAASRIAQPSYASMGKLTEVADAKRLFVLERFLQRSLFHRETGPDETSPHYVHPYKVAHFVDYLVHTEVDAWNAHSGSPVTAAELFGMLWSTVAMHLESARSQGRTDVETVQLEAFQLACAKIAPVTRLGFAEIYARFALHYLFDTASPLRGLAPQPRMPRAAIQGQSALGERSATCDLRCEPGPSTALHAVAVTTTGDAELTVQVRLLDLQAAGQGQCYAVVLPGGVRIGAAHQSPTPVQQVRIPAGADDALPGPAVTVRLRPGAGDELYLAAVDSDTGGLEAKLELTPQRTTGLLEVLHRTRSVRVTTIAGPDGAPDWQLEQRTYDFGALAWDGARFRSGDGGSQPVLSGEVSQDGLTLKSLVFDRRTPVGDGMWQQVVVELVDVPICPSQIPVPGRPPALSASFAAIDYQARDQQVGEVLRRGSHVLRRVEGGTFDSNVLEESTTALDQAWWKPGNAVFLEIHFQS